MVEFRTGPGGVGGDARVAGRGWGRALDGGTRGDAGGGAASGDVRAVAAGRPGDFRAGDLSTAAATRRGVHCETAERVGVAGGNVRAVPRSRAVRFLAARSAARLLRVRPTAGGRPVGAGVSAGNRGGVVCGVQFAGRGHSRKARGDRGAGHGDAGRDSVEDGSVRPGRVADRPGIG